MEPLEFITGAVRTAIFGEPLPEPFRSLTPGEAVPLQQQAQRHRLEQLSAYALQKTGPAWAREGEFGQQLSQAQKAAILNYGLQQRALAEICALLEKNTIPFIPLKGSVLRAYYPQPWMRSSCDIDILVHPCDLERADALLQAAGFLYKSGGDHDRSYYGHSVHLELHYTLNAKNSRLDLDTRVWNTAIPKNGSACHMLMQPELFVCYHIVHAAKHFLFGGCGIRSVLDLKIMLNRMPFDRSAVDALLEEAGLTTFGSTLFRLADCWFGNAAEDASLREVSEYIVNGGVYGSMENYWKVHLSASTDQTQYIRSRFFLPTETMHYRYPVLDKAPYLLPFMWCKRAIGALSAKSGRAKLASELRLVRHMTDSEKTGTVSLLRKMELELSES